MAELVFPPEFGHRAEPSESPDRLPELTCDTVDMGRLGLDCDVWPHVETEGSRRVGLSTLKRWRRWHAEMVRALDEMIGEQKK